MTLPTNYKKKSGTQSESTNLIPKEKRWQFVNLNPSIPNIRGLIKIHKAEAPIRPIVNWENSPAYKVAKMLTNKLHTYAPLPYTYNIKNSQLINDLQEIPYDLNLRLASLDITNMYTNIPTSTLLATIKRYVKTTM